MSLLQLCRLGLLVFAAVTLVVIGDTAGKLLTMKGTDPAFVAWSRFVLGVVLVLPFSGIKRDELTYLKDWRVILRGAFITGGIFCILNALQTEPIANVFGAFFIGPVVSFILAILFLGERPSSLRSMLLALGFLGVMLVVRPGFGVSIGMVFALAAGTFYGCYLAATRLVAGSYRPRFLLLSQLIVGSILLTPLGLSSDLPSVTLPLAALIAISALGSALGNLLLVLANRQAEASLIAPLVYSQLLSATLAGILIFKDWPDQLTLLGLVLIFVSGVASLATQRATKH